VSVKIGDSALDTLNIMSVNAAEQAFLSCCGSTRWASAMAAARPFASGAALVDAADRIWAGLEPTDWREAFAAHPRIGESGGAAPHAGAKADWSSSEQSGVRDASASLRLRLAAANREYDSRFGYRFIICATGRSAEAMLADLDRRLANDPDQELRVAAEEQCRITRLRIGRLLESIT
jgi:2-oxo-4-hydroxy-4-carboxy-5-ureidoimidazoline decarboxylase